jgi:hypothetical protein
MTDGAKRCQWSIHEDKKWMELFIQFLEDEFKVNEAEFRSVWETNEQVPTGLAKRAWENLAVSLNKQRKKFVYRGMIITSF